MNRSSSGAVHGLPDETAVALEAAVNADPDHPIVRAARDVARSIGRAGSAADGPATTGVDLPLVVARDGIDHTLGVATFGWPGERRIDEHEATVLAAAADLIATAMDRARLTSLVHERSEWLERLAQSDPLTGLANLRTFGRVLELELARAGRQGGDVSVAVFDVDDFTAVNEAAGRTAGDDALRRVAEVLGGSVRLVDTIARTGGDEFAAGPGDRVDEADRPSEHLGDPAQGIVSGGPSGRLVDRGESHRRRTPRPRRRPLATGPGELELEHPAEGPQIRQPGRGSLWASRSTSHSLRSWTSDVRRARSSASRSGRPPQPARSPRAHRSAARRLEGGDA